MNGVTFRNFGLITLLFALLLNVPSWMNNEEVVTPGPSFVQTGIFMGKAGVGYTYTPGQAGAWDHWTQFGFPMIQREDGVWMHQVTPRIGGVWNGTLPAEGVTVTISSPTGLMKDVVITEVETGQVYRSQGASIRPETMHSWDFKVTNTSNSEVLCRGTMTGLDTQLARQEAMCNGVPLSNYTAADGGYQLQQWDPSMPEP